MVGNHFCTVLHHFLYFYFAETLQMNDLRIGIAPGSTDYSATRPQLVCGPHRKAARRVLLAAGSLQLHTPEGSLLVSPVFHNPSGGPLGSIYPAVEAKKRALHLGFLCSH